MILTHEYFQSQDSFGAMDSDSILPVLIIVRVL